MLKSSKDKRQILWHNKEITLHYNNFINKNRAKKSKFKQSLKSTSDESQQIQRYLLFKINGATVKNSFIKQFLIYRKKNIYSRYTMTLNYIIQKSHIYAKKSWKIRIIRIIKNDGKQSQDISKKQRLFETINICIRHYIYKINNSTKKNRK